MTRFALIFLFTLTVLKAAAQTVMPAEDVAKHLGKNVKIMDKVYSSKLENNDRILAVGGSATRPYLTVVIKSPITDEANKTIYTGHNVYVAGKLVKYKTGTAIIVTDPKQLRVVMVDMDKRKAFN